ncbi:MAG: PLP-dependent aminotransferase family protein [Nitrospinae bacterium]|nr:PLP-dependent aminotransferase family protein [Nitrospinota bacterium]
MPTPPPFDYDTVYSHKVRVGIPRTPQTPVPYDFAVGHPDASTFPSQALGEATTRMLLREGRELALYPGDMSHDAARHLVSRKLQAHEGVDIPPSRIIITNGSMQGLLMVAEAFINPGDTVIVEEFSYPGTLRAFGYCEPRYATVPTDEEGIIVAELARALDRLAARGVTPKLVYTIANFQNPTGSVMSLPRRRALMQLAEERRLLVIEDDAYGDLVYEGEPVTSLYALSRTDNVVRLGTFSKIVAAGVRLGWVIAPEPVLARLAVTKIDGGTSAFTSRAVAEYLQDHLDARMATLLGVYRSKRDAMLEALEEHLSGVATWSRPRGGLFIWVRLPEGYNTTTLLEAAHASGVAYLPGTNFSPEGKGASYLRLSFAYLSPETIRAGIALLARVVKAARPLKATALA